MNLYFFSGTGNSLFVARELQKRFPETALIPIACLLDREVIAIEGETVGLVFPIHGMSLPIPIRLLLEKATWESPRYVFAIATRGGTVFTGFKRIARVLRKWGKRLDASFALTMLNNDPKFKTYPVATPDAIAKSESEVRERLDTIQHVIAGRFSFQEADIQGVTFRPFSPFGSLWNGWCAWGWRWWNAPESRTISTRMRNAPAAAPARRSVRPGKSASRAKVRFGRTGSSATSAMPA